MEATKPFTIDNLLAAFARIYQQFAPENISVIENAMRKMVPSENSTVYMAGGANFTENRISVNITVTEALPEEQAQNMDFVSILKACMLKADVEKLARIYGCISFLENSWGETYFIDGTYPQYSQKNKDYYFHFVILKEKKKHERSKNRRVC